jgi:hypothetical protein
MGGVISVSGGCSSSLPLLLLLQASVQEINSPVMQGNSLVIFIMRIWVKGFLVSIACKMPLYAVVEWGRNRLLTGGNS